MLPAYLDMFFMDRFAAEGNPPKLGKFLVRVESRCEVAKGRGSEAATKRDSLIHEPLAKRTDALFLQIEWQNRCTVQGSTTGSLTTGR